MVKLIEDAGDKTIEQVFSNDFFFIPKFQRNFVWDWNKTKKILNDILSNKEYFIGNIVVYNEEEKHKKSIVDGQQRLTVLTVILCALREINDQYGYESGIKQLIERVDISSGKNIPVLDIDSSYPYFRKNIQKMQAGDINNEQNDNIVEKHNFEVIEKIYQNTLDYLNELIKPNKDKNEKIREIFTKILNTKVIFISTSNIMNSNLIFEILNTGNTPLSELDLFKNLTYKNLKNIDTDHDEISSTWKILEKEANTAGIKLNDYLYNEIQLFFKKDLLTKKGFFEKLNDKIHNGDPITITKNFFLDFKKNLKNFIKIINPLYQTCNVLNNYGNNGNIKDIKNLKLNLNDLVSALEIKQHISPVYMAYIMYLNNKLSLVNFTKYILYLENSHFIFSNLLDIKSSILSHDHNKLGA